MTAERQKATGLCTTRVRPAWLYEGEKCGGASHQDGGIPQQTEL